MALGSSVFASDTYPQDIGIQDRPIGLVATARIIHDTNTQVGAGTTLKDWMNLLLSTANGYGKYAEVADALGASGFFPQTETIASYGTDRTPTKIIFNGYTLSSNKEFVIWRQPTTGYIKYLYHSGDNTYTYTVTSVSVTAQAV